MADLLSLKELLTVAQRKGFAVGAFSPRYTPLISPILRAGEATQSPLIVQIAQVELEWYGLTLSEFARQFWSQYRRINPQVPVGLHLDHTRDLPVIEEAIANGFTSVMIDASALELEANIARTRKVVALAHPHGVSVEAELGRIGAADFIETDRDEELYTVPEEAACFVEKTGVDALAVSVGTAHGVYTVRQPKIDLERIKAIRALTPAPLVLHGGSGTPAAMVLDAIHLPGGGISKVNIATDLELALLAALGRKERLTDAGLRLLPDEALVPALGAVQQVVAEKMIHFLDSQNHAQDFSQAGTINQYP